MFNQYYTRRPFVNTITATNVKKANPISHSSINIQIHNIQKEHIIHVPQLIDQDPIAQETNKVEKQKESFGKQIVTWIVTYFIKFVGLSEKRPKRIAWHEYFWSFIGSFIGILVVASMHYHLLLPHDLTFLIGSFGASAVLIYAAPTSPLAQPRNFIGGNFFSAIVGCAWRVAIYRFEPEVTAALAVATSIVVMQFTETVHPPGGAVALIAVTMDPTLPWANFLYIFVPVITGSIMMLIVALLLNNLSNHRTYPSWWW